MGPITLDNAVGLVTIVAVAIAAYGLFHNIRVCQRQSNTQLFLDYTARYERIMASFPPEALSSRLDITGELPPKSAELSLAVLRYLNLCSEEYYLYKRGYLDRDIWTVWEAELTRTLGTPLLVREWRKLESEFESYPQFIDFVKQIQKTESDRR